MHPALLSPAAQPAQAAQPAGPVFSHRHFHARSLVAEKERQGVTTSLCIPARDEAATIGRIVTSARLHLAQRVPLLDEIVVVDDGSTDRTAEVAAAAGARVVSSASLLPEAGPGSGKGDAIWKSIHASSGDLLCWVDGDILDFGPRFVVGLLGPLLTRPAVQFVKAFYRRPGGGATGGGGRVTELVARPLISRLFPHLAGVVQPLAGEYAARRPLIESLPVVEGWGVDLALIIDVAARAGLPALAQVDLGSRRHRHRPLDQLAPQAMAVMVTALRRAGVSQWDVKGLAAGAEEPGSTGWWPEHKLLRFDAEHRAQEVAVETRERPPLAIYRARDELSA